MKRKRIGHLRPFHEARNTEEYMRIGRAHARAKLPRGKRKLKKLLKKWGYYGVKVKNITGIHIGTFDREDDAYVGFNANSVLVLRQRRPDG